MKTVCKLMKLVSVLPESVRKSVIKEVECQGQNPEEAEIKRTTFAPEVKIDLPADQDRTAVQYVSTRDIDRDSEILMPKGAILTEFKKAPQVLWGHDYSLPPIGSDTDIKADDYGLLATTKYATTERAEEVWLLKKEGHLKTSSVGFVPLAHTQPGHNDWEKTVRKLGNDWPEFGKTAENVKRIITKWLLLEHSDVSVPANINALTLAVSKGLAISEQTRKELGIVKLDLEAIATLAKHKPTDEEVKRIVKEQPQRVIKLVREPENVHVQIVQDTVKIVKEVLDLKRGAV